jgi:apoptotic chromatin condensation inducer in the nucleus
LFIDRFVRPFLPKQVKELLEKTGEVDYFWMNNVRSHCYVTFKTVEQAKATREAVYNLVWPPANKSALIAEFSTEEEALRRAAIAKAREEPAQPQQQQQAAAPQPALSKSTEQARTDRDKERGDRDNRDNRDNRDRRDGDRRDNRDRRDSDRHDRDRRDTKPPPPPKVTLESLFRKTVARPCVYWLPLTDKDVEDKQNKANTATTAST